ncbi:MAG: hypothetical protein K2I53_07435 [Lachnospiraceae bacterium]|nr:hypothetical protein [Lachnospiraceae bacterium]
MKKMGRRMVARLMAGVLAVSLGLVPASKVRAEEIRSEDMLEVITADHGEGVLESEKIDALGDEAASVSGNGATGEEDNEPEDETVKEKPDGGNTEAEEQEEDSAVEETTEEPEEDLQGNLAEEIEESVETVEADAVSANTINSEDDNIASGVIDEEYGHIIWVIDQNNKLTVTGTGILRLSGIPMYGASLIMCHGMNIAQKSFRRR